MTVDVKNLAAMAFALPMVLGANTSLAYTSASASSYVSGTVGAPSDVKSVTGANGQSSSVSANVVATAGSIYSHASASAYASEGILGVSLGNDAVAASQSGFVVARGDSYARASWGDYFTIDAGSSMLAQSGYVTATMRVLGTFGGTNGAVGPSSSAEHYENIRILGTGITTSDSACGGYNVCNFEDVATWGVHTYHPGIPSTIALKIPILFGFSNGLTYTLDLQGLAMAGAQDALGSSAHAYADYSNLVLWGGITGVFDAHDNSVSNFTASSRSGFNYLVAPPVPEPEPYAMVLAGLGMIGVMARRRKVRFDGDR